eukprot:3835874-Rhodomonas_salina.1
MEGARRARQTSAAGRQLQAVVAEGARGAEGAAGELDDRGAEVEGARLAGPDPCAHGKRKQQSACPRQHRAESKPPLSHAFNNNTACNTMRALGRLPRSPTACLEPKVPGGQTCSHAPRPAPASD